MIVRWIAISAARIAGITNTCAMNSRDSNTPVPGKRPPHSAVAKGPPTRGSDIATPQAIASPMPESRSSGSE